jgi:protein FrlC
VKLAFNALVYASHPTLLPAYDLEYAIADLAEIGYDAIEIGAAAPHAWPYYLDGPRRAAITRSLEAHDLAISSICPALGGGAGLNPASRDHAERAASLQYYRACVELAADLGAPTVIWVGGWVPSLHSRAEASQRALEVLADVADRAASLGVRIVVEPTPADTNLIESADDAIALVEQLDRPNVGLMLDTLHTDYRREPAADYVDRFGERLWHVHLSDVDRLPPGAGTIDFEPVLAALARRAYDGYVAIEIGFGSRHVDPRSIARSGLQHVAALLAELEEVST